MNTRKLLLLGLIGFYSCAPLQAAKHYSSWDSKSKSVYDQKEIDGYRAILFLGTVLCVSYLTYLIYEEIQSLALTPEQLKLVACHEAGHTLIALHNESITGWPFKDVTIVPSLSGSLGHTTLNPSSNKMVLFTKEQCIAHIRVFLGGYVAEELMHGQTTSGVSGDLAKASLYARHMVTFFGMNETTGKVFYSGNNYSEQSLQKIDAAVQQIVEEQYEWVKAYLEEKKESLQLLSDTLLKKKTMTCKDVKELLAANID